MMTLTSVVRAIQFDKTFPAFVLCVGLAAGGVFVGLGIFLNWMSNAIEYDWLDQFAVGFICGFVSSLLGGLTDYRK